MFESRMDDGGERLPLKRRRPGQHFIQHHPQRPDVCPVIDLLAVEGLGPGALADPTPFLGQLSDVGLEALVEAETTGFHFANFAAAWDALAAVTTAALDPVVQDQAKSAVRDRMWAGGDGPREFRNRTQFIIATRSD